MNDSCYTVLKELVQQLTLLKMTTTSPRESTPKAGSIAVYQPMLPGKRPKKVEVIRSVHESLRGPDGRAFGRNKNKALLRIASGTVALSEGDCKILRDCGLDEMQLAYVNSRLSTLAGPAQARTREMDILEAKEKLKFVVTLSESAPSMTKDLRAILTGALHEIEEPIEAEEGSADSDGKAPTELLKNILVLLNQACVDAQALYKRLPKGELPDDVILEFQKSWFLHAEMLGVFRNRKSFARPAGWSGLHAQVFAGRVYKQGDPIPDGRTSSSSDAD